MWFRVPITILIEKMNSQFKNPGNDKFTLSLGKVSTSLEAWQGLDEPPSCSLNSPRLMPAGLQVVSRSAFKFHRLLHTLKHIIPHYNSHYITSIEIYSNKAPCSHELIANRWYDLFAFITTKSDNFLNIYPPWDVSWLQRVGTFLTKVSSC